MEEQPIATVVQEPTLQPEETKKGDSTLWLIVIVVLVVAVIAGAYWYMNSQSQTASTTKQGADLETLNSELDTVDEAVIDSDFAEVDKDLQSL